MVNLDSTIKMLQDKREELLDQLDAVDRAIAALKSATAGAGVQEHPAQASKTAPAETLEILPTILKPKRILSDKHKQALLDGRRKACEAKDVSRGVAREPLSDQFVPAIAQPADELPRLVKRNHNRELTIEPLVDEMPQTQEEAFAG